MIKSQNQEQSEENGQKEIASRIKICSNIVGSIAKLARTSGVAKGTLNNHVSGRFEPRLSALMAIAEAANVSFDWLATGRGAAPETKSQEFSEELPKRLKECIELLEGQHDLAAACGLTKAALGRYTSGQEIPSLKAIVSIARLTGVGIEWLATGEGQMIPSEQEEGELVKIPRYKARMSAGAGSWNSDHAKVIEEIPFPKRWLLHTTNRETAEDLMLLQVEGDSMEPTISRGDLVLIDRRNCDDRLDGIYAFVQEGTAKVKRLHFLGERQGIEVISDNSALYSKQRLVDHDLEDFHLIGRVCWIGKSLKS